MSHPFASDVLDAELDASTPQVALFAETAAGGPSNQQVIDAAKAAYGSYQPAVDAITLSRWCSR